MSDSVASNAPSTPDVQAPEKNSCGPTVGKSGKRICCSCPDTRQLRDNCVVLKGESECQELIEAHKACLRKEGFDV